MQGLSSELYRRCRNALLKCTEFDSNAALRSVFVTNELRPFRSGLPEAANKKERVDECLAFLMDKCLTDGRPVLPLFLAALRDRYQEGDALRDELDGLVQEVLTALTSLGVPSKEYRPGPTPPFPSASASPAELRTENNGDTTPELTPSVRPDLFPIVVSVIAATVLGLVSNALANMWRVDTPQRFLITIGVFMLALAVVLWAEFRREHMPIIGLSLLSIRAFAAIGLICFIGGIMVSVVSILTITEPTASTISPMPAVVASPKSTGTPTLGLTNTPTLKLTSTSLPTNSPAPTFAPIEAPTPEGMIYIQGGQFLMGSSDSQAPSDEHPQDWVTVADFWIDQHEVTNAQYRACVTEGFCRAPHRPDSEGRAPAPMSATRSDYYENPQFDQFPVIFVSWSDAFKYCKWQGKRLPTEAEWEWTAKGQEGFLYPWGNQPPSLSLANYGNENDTQMVGQYGPGAPHEIYDMAGNVWEWTSSLYKDYPYRSDDGREDVDAEGKRVLRGGSWRDPPDSLRTTNRDAGTAPDYPLDNVGFRCAKSVE